MPTLKLSKPPQLGLAAYQIWEKDLMKLLRVKQCLPAYMAGEGCPGCDVQQAGPGQVQNCQCSQEGENSQDHFMLTKSQNTGHCSGCQLIYLKQEIYLPRNISPIMELADSCQYIKPCQPVKPSPVQGSVLQVRHNPLQWSEAFHQIVTNYLTNSPFLVSIFIMLIIFIRQCEYLGQVAGFFF